MRNFSSECRRKLPKAAPEWLGRLIMQCAHITFSIKLVALIIWIVPPFSNFWAGIFHQYISSFVPHCLSPGLLPGSHRDFALPINTFHQHHFEFCCTSTPYQASHWALTDIMLFQTTIYFKSCCTSSLTGTLLLPIKIFPLSHRLLSRLSPRL